MANVREYKGARYVPIFAEPVEWTDTRAYEPLTMVQHVGETYMTRQAVPIGAQLPDVSQGQESTEYWVHMSDWNAQVETYRQEVLQYNGRISTLENDLPIVDFDSDNTVSDAIKAVSDLLPASEFSDINTVDARFNVIETNGWVDTNRMANNSVTTMKIADNAITSAKITNNAITKTKMASGVIEDVCANGKYIGLIGDSWSVDNNWCQYISEFTFINVAVSASGMNHGTTFQTQLTNLINYINTNNIDVDEINSVVVFGGVNDWRQGYTSTQVRSAVANFYNAYKASILKNTRLILIYGNTGICNDWDAITPQVRNSYKDFDRWITEIGTDAMYALGDLEWIGDSRMWLMSLWNGDYTNLYSSDKLHPTAIGYKVIASQIKAILNGSYSCQIANMYVGEGTVQKTVKNVTATITFKYSCVHGYFDYRAKVNFASDVNGGIIIPANTIVPYLTGMYPNDAIIGIVAPFNSLTPQMNCYLNLANHTITVIPNDATTTYNEIYIHIQGQVL